MNRADAVQVAARMGLGYADAALLLAIATLETSLGSGWAHRGNRANWTGAGANSNNWGAIQAHGWSGQTFREWDAGPSGPYLATFRAYPSPEAGASDLWSLLARKYPGAVEAARAGDWRGVSEQLYRGGYYTGTSRDPATNVERHATRLAGLLAPIFEALDASGQWANVSADQTGGASGAILVLVGVGLWAALRKK
jgi:hypothetical protein